MPYEPITLPYDEIPGVISASDLLEHYRLYTGYVDCLNRIDAAETDIPESVQWESPFRAVKQAEGHCSAAVLLHEMYFLGLTDQTVDPDEDSALAGAMANVWEDFEDWWEELRGTALLSRGWAVMGACRVDPTDLRIFLLDAHDTGGIIGFDPIMVIDTYEHSYWAEFPNKKGDYIDALVGHFNWPEIEERYGTALDAVQKEDQ